MTDRPKDPVDFRNWLGIRPYSPAWTVTLKAAWGTPLAREERVLWKQVSRHGEERPGVGWFECFFNTGRGSGKDDATKTIVNFECSFGGHEIAAAPGQRLLVPVICPLRSQSAGMLRMVQGEAQLPKMRAHVANITKDSVEYVTGLVATVQTCDDVAVVGDTVPLAIRNEWALFNDAHSIDLNLRPSLRQIVGTPPHRLIGISSSYIRDDLAWETFRDNFGKADTDVLVVQGSTELFNPNVDKDWLAKERRRLGDRAYEMHFHCAWVDAVTDGWFGEAVGPSIDRGITQREPVPGVHYAIALDQAFRGDQNAVSVAHAEHRDSAPPLIVQDYARAWTRPGPGLTISVEHWAREIQSLCERYRTRIVFADQHCFDPLVPIFKRLGITLVERAWGATNKAPIYRAARDAMADGRWRLLDIPEQTREFHAIRGELLHSGVEKIEAGHGHDDRVSAAVLCMTEAQGKRRTINDVFREDPAGALSRIQAMAEELMTYPEARARRGW